MSLVSLGRRPAAAPARPGRFRLKTVDLGGPVAWADFGGEGPPLVLVHGVGGNHLNWLPAAPMLARSARVLAIDLAGFGRTPEAGRGHGMEAQRVLLDRFLAEVVGEPAVLVGNSMGGLVALMEAAAAPARVAGLVLVDAAQPPVPGALPTPWQAGRLLVDAIPLVGEAKTWLQGRRIGARGMFLDLLTFGCADVGRVPPEVVEANVSAIARRMDEAPFGHARSFLAATRSMIATLAVPGRFERWARAVRAPTLVVHGRQDRLVPVEASRRLVALRPDFRLVELDDCGHVPQMEHASTFTTEVTAWLADQGLLARRTPRHEQVA